MMPFEDAQRAVIDACVPRAAETLALHACVGRVLARDVIADADLVPFARSAMDGYAVRSADIERLPITLPVSGKAYAAPGMLTQTPGSATKIATGAAIPAGTDSVIPFEDVTASDGTIVISHPVRPGACIFPAGDDARRGDVLLARGTRLAPAGIALLAAAGISHVSVYRRPVVALICGGDELVDVDAVPGFGEIRDSNSLMLTTALAACGADVIPPVRLNDRPELVRAALMRAFERADLIVTTGGASVGERDFVKRACVDVGVKFCFRNVALRPAKPTAFGRRGEVLIAVLPGNPAAAFVAFMEFVHPAVRALCGDPQARLPRVAARLSGSLHAKHERHFAAFGAVATTRTGFVATPLENQCSSLTRTAATAAALIIVPPGDRHYVEGDVVDVDIFDWTRVLTSASASHASTGALSFGLTR